MFLRKQPLQHQEWPRVLMYHMIRDHVSGGRFNKMRVRPADFKWQMEWLRDDGWNFLSTASLLKQWGEWPAKSVVVTFDDGYRDNFLNAFPVLKALSIPFTIYLVCDRHNNDWSTNKKAHHSDGELARESKLADSEVVEMLDSGLLELGGHTLRHANLIEQKASLQKKEIFGCAEQLEEVFGVDVPTFCYPFGLYNEDSIKIVKEVPYVGAFTVEEALVREQTDPFQIGRLKVSGKLSRHQFSRMMNKGSR